MAIMQVDRRHERINFNAQSVKSIPVQAVGKVHPIVRDQRMVRSRTKQQQQQQETKSTRMKRLTTTSPDFNQVANQSPIEQQRPSTCKYYQINNVHNKSHDLKRRIRTLSTQPIVAHLLICLFAINLPITIALETHHHVIGQSSQRRSINQGQEYHHSHQRGPDDYQFADLLRVPSFKLPSSSSSNVVVASANSRPHQYLEVAESRQGHHQSIIPPPLQVTDEVDGLASHHSLASSLEDTETSFADSEDQSNNETPMININNDDVPRRASSYSHQPSSLSSSSSSSLERDDNDESMAENNSQEATPIERNMLMNHHNSQLKAMHDLFERRQLSHNSQQNPHQPLQSSQELNPISIGLDPNSPFSLPPFPVGPNEAGPSPVGPLPKAHLNGGPDGDQGMGPPLPFGLSPLPHLMGFPNAGFQGPQRGDQSAHANHHAAVAPNGGESAESGTGGGGGGGGGQKVWPKIFRFTDGRINLSDFEKQKKIRLSNKNQHNGENYIESAPVMFDGRPLKRKSFLILHGGIFSS